MAKLIGEKAVYNRLVKYMEANFTEDEQNDMEFYNDIEGERTWAWKFDLKGKTHVTEIDRATKKIKHMILN